MSIIQDSNQKLNLKTEVLATGVVGPQIMDIRAINQLRVLSLNANAATALQIRARVKGATTWDVLSTITGPNSGTIITCETYDELSVNCSVFVAPVSGTNEVIVSGFFKAAVSGGGGPPTGPAGGDLTGTYPDPTLAVDRVRIAGDTMTGELAINGPTDFRRLYLQAHTTQTNNMFEFLGATPGLVNYAVLTGAGRLRVGPNADDPAYAHQFSGHTNVITLGIRGIAGQTADALRTTSTALGTTFGVTVNGSIYTGLADLGAKLSVSNNTNAAQQAVIIRAHPAQATNILSVQNSGGANFFFIRQNGTIGLPSTAPGVTQVNVAAATTTGWGMQAGIIHFTTAGTERLRIMDQGIGVGTLAAPNSRISNAGSLTESGIQTVGVNTAIVDTDLMIRVQSLAGAITITLPNIAAALIGVGKRYRIKDVDFNAAVNNITILTSGGDTIEGLASFIISNNGACIELIAGTATNWDII